MFLTNFFAFTLILPFANCDEVRNITTQIFGEKTQILPLAFGDFNSDKLTDVIGKVYYKLLISDN